MDPQDPNSFRHRFSFVNGITYHEGEERNEAIVLCHGFPDLWYGWRYQIPFLVSKGYRVIVPDIRGYGQTEAPRCPPNSLHQYGYKNICKDLKEIMDQLKIQKAIFLGHDWGGAVAWRMCIHYPERVHAVISVCTPYFPPNDTFISAEALGEIFPNLQYQTYLSHPKAEIELDNEMESFFKRIYRTSKRKDLVKIFDGKSMTGVADEGIERSSLMTQKHIEEAGHWVMVEQTNQLHEYIEEFLENLKKITHKLLLTSDTEAPLFYQDSESDNEDDKKNEQLLRKL
ncbi:5070_t:CDS:2 [Gigaspora margarita]|uniref:5070_t:CDS:1 n=1 Tax=Gigaspora margarita TaxID=4874 RepID=A0ABN7UEZ4_GIGMA|nr:5070_t:CDS:2 [Gigaspora margarita]